MCIYHTPHREAREAQQHDKVSLLHPLPAHPQVAGRAEGHVLFAVRRRGLAVGCDVRAEQGEVRGVSRPLEVVCLAAEVAFCFVESLFVMHVCGNGCRNRNGCVANVSFCDFERVFLCCSHM